MRVAVVTTWFPTPVAPTSGAFVARDARALADAAHDVVVVHLVPPHQDAGDRTAAVGGLRVRRVPMSTTNPVSIARAARAVRPLLEGADVVHSMAFSALLPLAVRRPAAPWVHTEHWSGLTQPATLPRSWRLGLPALRGVLRGPEVVTAVCEYLARPLREVRGHRRDTRVVPCIVEVPGGPAPRPPRTGRLRLISVGALIDRKDPVIAVDTLAELRRRGVPAQLTWVGEGPLREAVIRRATERGLADDVRLTGTLPPPGVATELARADLFFGPTRAENFFVSAAEALLRGRPVVVGATGGHGEYIEASVGELVDEQSPGAYADAIERLHHATRHLDAETIAGTLGRRFAAEAVSSQYADAYAEAVRRYLDRR